MYKSPGTQFLHNETSLSKNIYCYNTQIQCNLNAVLMTLEEQSTRTEVIAWKPFVITDGQTMMTMMTVPFHNNIKNGIALVRDLVFFKDDL